MRKWSDRFISSDTREAGEYCANIFPGFKFVLREMCSFVVRMSQIGSCPSSVASSSSRLFLRDFWANSSRLRLMCLRSASAARLTCSGSTLIVLLCGFSQTMEFQIFFGDAEMSSGGEWRQNSCGSLHWARERRSPLSQFEPFPFSRPSYSSSVMVLVVAAYENEAKCSSRNGWSIQTFRVPTFAHITLLSKSICLSALHVESNSN